MFQSLGHPTLVGETNFFNSYTLVNEITCESFIKSKLKALEAIDMTD